jgi:uncharacterized YigZ family protein
MFKTIKENVQAEIVEKKSKFIANLFFVETVEDAEQIIKDTKRKYFDAKHNCFAYRISDKDSVIERFSDDGEPSGTAGAPMLAMLSGNNLSNVVVVVTRYFGGVLLGTGGLIRAYTGALSKAIENAKFEKKELGLEILLEVSYSDLEKLKYYCKVQEIKILSLEYSENIKLTLEMSNEKYKTIENNKNELNFVINEIHVVREKYITL